MKIQYEILIENLAQAVKQERPYVGRHEFMPLSPHSELQSAAVLLLFALNLENEVHILFVRRADHIETHRGQMAFPGGRVEPEDGGSSIATALRETEEEVGVLREQIEVIGLLPQLQTITGFQIEPVVGALKSPLESMSLKLDAEELAEAFWVPLSELDHPDVYTEETFVGNEQAYQISIYTLSRCRIWGATGAMTKNILDRYFQR